LIRVKKILSTDIVKVSSLSALSTIIKMMTGMVSMKVVAIAIGPVGVALLGQLNNFSTMVLGISNGGINAGITKFTAEYSQSPRRYTLFLGTGFWITLVLSFVTGIVLVVGADYFAQLILKDASYRYVFYVFGATVILYALNALLISVMNGFREFRKFTIANIIASITGLVFAVVLASLYHIPGALIGVISYQSVVFFITLILVARAPWFRWREFTRQFSKSAARKLSHFSLMAIVSALLMPAAQLIVRDYIGDHGGDAGAGLREAGLWEAVNKISIMYLMVVTTSLGVYYLPKLTELKTDGALRKEVFTVYKLLIPFLLSASLFIFFAKPLIIQILYSSEFMDMEKFFIWQLPGDIFKMSGWVLGYIMIARSMTRSYVIMEFISAGAQIGFSILFINLFGSVGGSIGYSAGHLLYFLIMFIIFRKIFFLPASQRI
jgi:PST family polysaccharide transporter